MSIELTPGEHPTQHPDGWHTGDRVEIAGRPARRERPSRHIWATGYIVDFGIQNPDIVKIEPDCPMPHGVKSFLADVSKLTRISDYDDSGKMT